MPRVRTYDAPQVASRPIGTPYSNVNTDTGTGALVQGVEQLNQGLQSVGADLERVKQKADTVAVTNAETAYQHEITSTLNGNAEKQQAGFLSMRGQDAAAGSAKTLETLEAARQKIADGLTNNEQKKLFTMRAGGLYEDARRTVESHVSRQVQEAEVASVAARREAALTTIANNYADPATVARQMVAMEGPIRALSLSKEDADAKIADLHRDAAKVRLNQYLAAKDWNGAETLFAQVKEQLGAEAPQFQNVISTLKQKQEGEALALDVVNGARKPNGFVDHDAAIKAFQSLPQERRTEDAEQAFRKWLSLEDDKRKEVTGDYYNKALTAFLQRHTLADIDPQVKAWMRGDPSRGVEGNDPQGWLQLEGFAQRAADRYRENQDRKQRQPKTVDQANSYGELLLSMADNPKQFGNMTVGEFAKDWSGRLTLEDYQRGLGLLSQIHEDARKPPKSPPSAIDGMAAVKSEFQSTFSLKSDPSTWSDAQRGLYAGVVDYVAEQERQFRAEHPDKAPSAENYRAWIGTKLTKGAIPDTGFFSDDTVTRSEFESNPKYAGKQFIEKDVPGPGDLPDNALTALGGIVKSRGLPDTQQSQRDIIAEIARGLTSAGRRADAESIARVLLAHARDTELASTPPMLRR